MIWALKKMSRYTNGANGRSCCALALLVSVLSSDCGYALAGRGSFLPDYVETIGIPLFENNTAFFEMEQILTEAVRTEFIGRGSYQIVPEEDGVDAVLIAGGHVGVLMDRLRLFDVFSTIPTTPVVAWSGGAIVVAERIVLFHDSPPQGRGNPEVHAPGLGLVSGLVALPHAADRLRLEDPARVSLFARRFAPDLCVAMDDGARIQIDGPRAAWRATEATRILGTDGRVLEMQPA